MAAGRPPRPVVTIRRAGVASVGASWSGPSARRSAASSPPGRPGSSGRPGAVLFYCAAGILIALPERAYATARLGRIVLPGRGVPHRHGGAAGLAGTGVLAGPRRDAHRHGPLHGPDPQPASSRRGSRPSGTSSPPTAGRSTCSSWSPWPPSGACCSAGAAGSSSLAWSRWYVLCLADWVLVEDLGFLGGVGTDPNSMLPMALLFVAGYVAMVRVPVPPRCRHRGSSRAPAPQAPRAGAPAWWERASLSYASARPPPSPRWPSSSSAPPRWRRRGQRQRRPRPDRGPQRQPQHAGTPGAPLHADRPARPDRSASAASGATRWR